MSITIPNHWQPTLNGLYRKWVFSNFIEAFAFMSKVALVAEKQDHHPNWSNTYNTVEIYLNTHDAGGAVTNKDVALANAINQLAI